MSMTREMWGKYKFWEGWSWAWIAVGAVNFLFGDILSGLFLMGLGALSIWVWRRWAEIEADKNNPDWDSDDRDKYLGY